MMIDLVLPVLDFHAQLSIRELVALVALALRQWPRPGSRKPAGETGTSSPPRRRSRS